MKKQSKTVLLSTLACQMLMNNFAQAMPAAVCQETLITFSFINTTLNFASLEPCTATAGTVTIDAVTGTRTTGGCITSVSGAPFRAQVKVSGNQGGGAPGTLLVSIPGTASIKFGGNTLSVTGLSLNPGGGTTDTIPNAKKSETYLIGGTLKTVGGDANGSYSGTFTISASCL